MGPIGRLYRGQSWDPCAISGGFIIHYTCYMCTVQSGLTAARQKAELVADHILKEIIKRIINRGCSTKEIYGGHMSPYVVIT